ncbi:hypothetical protein CYJ76_09540 [Kytococcus schroeteri]|uniref:Uncharacterized protein n=1 Tax=Kytococcus schroeteri TaxID=138300 RepID=A0A2I1P8W1_9MICO|nr:hypothetical protein [Kytococcus schroeteri]PKZ41069.1 hypothetical protein CYJ76_09540 [Kytococcus schroeteri]
MGEWGALEWIVAVVLLALVVGIVWFMTQGGAVQDRLSRRGEDYPEIDEHDRLDDFGRDADEDELEGGARPAARRTTASAQPATSGTAGRRGKGTRAAATAGTSGASGAAADEVVGHEPTDLFDQDSDDDTQVVDIADLPDTADGAHALGDDEAVERDEDKDREAAPAAVHTLEDEGDESDATTDSETELRTVDGTDTTVRSTTVDEHTDGPRDAVVQDPDGALTDLDPDDEITVAGEHDHAAAPLADTDPDDDPSDIEAGTSTDPGELHSIEAEDADDIEFPDYREPGTEDAQDEELTDFVGPGGDDDTLPADTTGQDVPTTAGGDDDLVSDEDDWDDVQPTDEREAVEPGTVDAPEADFPEDDQLPDVAPSTWGTEDDAAEGEEPVAADPEDASPVVATSTQEWLGRGELPAGMDADELDPYSDWQERR